ncbi:heparan-alpha-glucosaminide N-acetyltransferase domain-containing protein [Quadrisphaera setariae]|uniref:DUF1624 domain-containing protein n=1 Tax=Quadrisphaera setariae TaxID=2593304 RepID=A0A5C8ZGN4_9ACTN|nr:heparan-alpha-glucosaminide N-acetyltransferase domain-containing protein [Quadrisphaera setariae]TXR56967.1 DUF1624 domain-containing protein [Quadrisphaera setariae]
MTTTGAEALLPSPRPQGDASEVPQSSGGGESTSPPASVQRPRLRGVDLARGLAVLGMFAAHIGAAPTFLASDPSTWGGVAHGRSSILFATLAGVSVALMSGRTTPPGDEDVVAARLRLLVRAVCLFLVGGLVQYLSTPVAVILEFYAVLLVLCVPLLRWRPRHLFLLAAGIALVLPGLRALLVAAQGTSSWLGSGGELGTLAVSGMYPAVVWAAFVVAGLGVGRCDLTAARVKGALVAVGVALAVVGYGGSWALTQAFPSIDPMSPASSSAGPSSSGPYPEPQQVPGSEVDLTGFTCMDQMDGTYWCADDSGPNALNGPPPGAESDAGAGVPPFTSSLRVSDFLGTAAHSGATPEVIGSGGVALAVLGTCLALADALGRRRAGGLVAPLVAVGAMPLTAYCAHLVAIAVVGHLPGGMMAEGEPGWLSGSWQLWALFAGAALVVCTLWGRFLGRGPLERLISWTARRATRA